MGFPLGTTQTRNLIPIQIVLGTRIASEAPSLIETLNLVPPQLDLNAKLAYQKVFADLAVHYLAANSF
jgi:hypothetical protein